MGKCIIFCAGGFDGLAEPILQDDYIIAADGGWEYAKALKLPVDAALGDFDSLGYIPQDAHVHPVEKDDTDAMLAVRLGLARGFKEFVIYGGLDGPRLDHTIANFQTLQFLENHGARGTLVGLSYMATTVSEEKIEFPTESEGILSLFCLGKDAEGVCISGLQYPLENGTITPGFPLGVSNHFVGEEASVSVQTGSLLALWDRKNGFPRRSSLR